LVLVAVCAADFARGVGEPVEAVLPTEPVVAAIAPTEPATKPVVMTARPVINNIVAMSLPKEKGSGQLRYEDDAEHLLPQQEKLLTGLMDAYYTSLANLKAGNPSKLFAKDAADNLSNEITLWEVVVGIRSMQQADLSLAGYEYTLTVVSATENDDGDLSVRVSEDFTQNFAEFPDVDSKGMNVIHTFTLTETAEGWRIREHRQNGSQNRVIYGGWRPSSGSRTQASKASVLASAKANIEAWKTQGTDPGTPAFDHAYDRDAAVAYARRWVGERNPDWVVYDRSGGNCQNFTSQAMLAGGIPMDVTSPGQWKWYGATPSSSFQAAGRSPSWSSVSEFLTYAGNNKGFGLVAAVDAPYYSGEIGDIIHLGTNDDWRHTVMITEVIRDKAGKTIDYLVASNTADLVDYPVSAYHYTQQMLIKIYGWNG
jgi:hypothetical protein